MRDGSRQLIGEMTAVSRNSCSSFMHNGSAPLEDDLAVSYKTKMYIATHVSIAR